MKNIFLLLLIFITYTTVAQLPNCAGADSNCIFIEGGNTIFKYDPALPISAGNPSVFLATTVGLSGLTICNNINGGAVSPTFYSNVGGQYHWYDGTNWINTGHTSTTVNLGGGATAIYGKEGGSGTLTKYVGTGNDFIITVGVGNGGPFDLSADLQDNFYEPILNTSPGKIYKRNSTGVIIDTITVLGVPIQTAGPGFALIGNRVYFGINLSPAVYSGTIINDTVNALPLGSFANSGGDYASCPKGSISTSAASLVYPTCTGPIPLVVTSPMLNNTATLLWNFGDPASGINNTSTLLNTTHTFSSNGTYTVTTYITSSLGLDTVTNVVVISNFVTGSSTISICAPNTYQGHNISGVYIDTFAISAICDSIHTLNLAVNPIPVLNFGPDIAFCSSAGTAILDAGPGFTNYLWDNSSTFQTRTVNAFGSYFCTVTDANGCQGSDTVGVIIDTTVKADFTFMLKLGCTKDTVQFVNLSSGASSYVWSFGNSQGDTATNPQVIYGSQLVYTVTLVATNNICSDTIQAVVDVTHPMNAQFVAFGNGGNSGATLHPDSTCILFDLDVQSTSFPIGSFVNEWSWGDGSVTNSGLSPFAKHFYPVPGVYTLTLKITDSIGCSDLDSTSIYVDDVAHADFTISDSVLCVGEPITFNDEVGSYSWFFEYDFADGSTLANVHDPVHSFDKEGNFVITLTARNLLCPDSTHSESVVIDDYPDINLGRDTSICPGLTGTVFLNNVVNPAGVYEWSTGDITNTLSVVNPGVYWAKAVSSNAGCASVDSIWIRRDCYLSIPNSFSPNNDGLNDYFIPRELLSSGVITFTMNIFNRWGENIFGTTRLDGRGWDGKFNGKLQNMGVYIYLMDVEFRNGIKKSYKGNVTLVR